MSETTTRIDTQFRVLGLNEQGGVVREYALSHWTNPQQIWVETEGGEGMPIPASALLDFFDNYWSENF